MKRIFYLYAALHLLQCTGSAQLPALQQKAITVKRLAELRHYSPRAVDDSFSRGLFRSVLDKIDSRRLYFTDGEYKNLLVCENILDDEMRGKGWKYYDLLLTIYKSALLRADSIVNKLLQKPFDYSQADILGQMRKGAGFIFAKDVPALVNRWMRYLKLSILTSAYETSLNEKTAFIKLLNTKEPLLREKIRKGEMKIIHRDLDSPAGLPENLKEIYLDALAQGFDPHTNYLSVQGKEQFQEQVSSEGYYFGIVFTENEEGKIVVDKLTPGGAAWKSGEMNKGDELLSILWEGKEAQDMEGASLEDVYEALDISVHDRMIFRLKKPDGTISNVILRKEKMENEENIVKSYVLNGEKKIGYIVLPGFYTEWENEKGSRCASDVAKEILKLKKENIDGLMIDLRFNGGGSIGEAIEMTGLFVEEGPLGAQKDRSGKISTFKDPNRGTIYDGPLILMINGQSASASEMLAGSLQDYNRAVIIGSTTYGKATMQELFPADTTSNKVFTGTGKGDLVKVTTAKLYRVSGGTAQQSGVMPDVQLPDAFEGMEIGERFEKLPLQADTIKRNSYYKPLPPLPVKELSVRSNTRLNAWPEFQHILRIISERKNQLQNPTRTIPLKAELFEKWLQQQYAEQLTMKGEGGSDTLFYVSNHASDKQLLGNDSYAKEINDETMKSLSKDIYIQETFNVIIDLIRFSNVKKN